MFKGKEVTQEEVGNIKRERSKEPILEQKERTVIVPTMMIMDKNNGIKEVEVESAVKPLNDVEYLDGNRVDKKEV
ncbi:MAG: hypothetical protein E7216_11545 [Clostridium thermopalmarium]|uniref:hypothetical protein n=1 Tax=Clostridium thermopalmarium TaxID=29373 RepID=UPI0023525E03|nr:hypothetical protein [Clostridium thermopalmarium]MBE6044849.1 hypothetical protein [Clostridium thermopalmarium]